MFTHLSMTRSTFHESSLTVWILSVLDRGRLPCSRQTCPSNHAAKAPEMLSPFTHCERPREPSCIDADPSGAASMKLVVLMSRMSAKQWSLIRANFFSVRHRHGRTHNHTFAYRDYGHPERFLCCLKSKTHHVTVSTIAP
ncbi:hypothetical protein M3J09_008654 [Ascochyta lentis]